MLSNRLENKKNVKPKRGRRRATPVIHQTINKEPPKQARPIKSVHYQEEPQLPEKTIVKNNQKKHEPKRASKPINYQDIDEELNTDNFFGMKSKEREEI